MPLVRIDAIEGRSKREIKDLLYAVHRAVLSAFKVPQRDRYQIYHQHPDCNFIVEDTGLGIDRTAKAIVITLTSMLRSQELKLQLYKDFCREKKAATSIPAM